MMKLAIASMGLIFSGIIQPVYPFPEHALRGSSYWERRVGSPSVKPSAEKGTLKEERQSGPGGLPFTTFNEDQLIDVTGEHAWVAPGPKDIRGPCPGLNALANHGYFPHSGVVPLTVGASATEQVYG